MKKILSLFFISILLLASCNKDTAVVSIEGTISDSSMNGKKVNLYTLNIDTMTQGGQPTLSDSIHVNDGKFVFKKEFSKVPSLGLISFGNENGSDPNTPSDIFVILEEGTVKVNIDGQRVTLQGTERNRELNNALYALMNKTLDIRDEVQNAGGNVDNIPLDADGNDVMKRMKILMKGINKGVYSFTKANMNNEVGEILFVAFFNSFNATQRSELITLSDTIYQNKEFIKYIKEETDYRLRKEAILVGHPFKDLILENKMGSKTSLSAYIGKGKYVFVDFWATWCHPCLEQIRGLMEVYATNKNKKFEIISVSVEQKKSDWINALPHINMEWPQLFDTNQKAAETYGFDAIPFTLLTDPEGKIIAMGLTPDDLEDKLEELLK